MILTFLFLFISLGMSLVLFLGTRLTFLSFFLSWTGIGEGKVFFLSFFIIFIVLAFGNDTNVPFSFLFFRDEFRTKVNGGWWFFFNFNFSNFFFDLFIERSILLVERFRHSFDVT